MVILFITEDRLPFESPRKCSAMAGQENEDMVIASALLQAIVMCGVLELFERRSSFLQYIFARLHAN